jgi:hypothetical protein
VSEPTRSRQGVVAVEPVNEPRAEMYARLMDAQERIAQALYERGVKHDVVLAALDGADEALSESERHEDLYLAALAHFVRALGGQLEVRALFGDQAIVVRCEPDDATRSRSA